MPPPDPHSVGHEADVIRFRWIVLSVATLAIVLAATFFAMRFLLGALTRWPRSVDAPRSVVEHVRPVSNGPPLQPSPQHDTSPSRDLATMRADEDRVFTSLGWTIDPTSGQPTVPAAIVASVAARSTPRPTTREAAR